ncbi:MAG: hypothetical protein ACRDYC_05320, partial [Acidimicrobiales bacterium]
ASVAEQAWSQGHDVEAALRASFALPQPDDESAVDRMEALNGIHSNAAGLRGWLARTGRPGAPGRSGGSGGSEDGGGGSGI